MPERTIVVHPFTSDARFRCVLFAGIDLGWKVNGPKEGSTAICVIDEAGGLKQLELTTSDEEILERLLGIDQIWVGIDAPLLVPNLKGMRRCERMLFDRGVRALPSNVQFMERKFGGMRGQVLSRRLYEKGFSPSSPLDWAKKTVFEVYPYGTLWILTNGRVPAYKRGRFEVKKSAMREAVTALEAWDAPSELVRTLRYEVEAARPSELKGVTDLIDSALSVICVYQHRLSRGQRTQLIGEQEHGYVLLPAVRSQA